MGEGGGAPARLTPGLVGLLLALAGCSSAHRDPAGGAALIPWDDTVPAAVQPAVGPPAPPCAASRLAVAGAGFTFTATASGGEGVATLRNTGPEACRLTGRPDVQVVGANPAPPQQQTPLPAQRPAFPTVAPPDSALLAVPPGGAATVAVEWRNWCVPPTSAAPVPPRAIRLTLPDGGGSIDVAYNAIPRCTTPSAPTTLGIRPFRPAPLPATAPWTSAPVQAAIEPLPGDDKLTGRRGQPARFAVRLSNPSSVPVAFTRCPLFVELLAPSGQPEVHQLDCGPASQIPVGGALRFEMRIHVPADAPAGDNGLFWQLDPTGSQGPQAVSRLAVTG